MMVGKWRNGFKTQFQKKTGSEIRCIGSVFCSVFWSYGPLFKWRTFCNGEQELETVQQLEHLAASQLAQIAVPGFFMISAYLFYRNFQLNSLFSKWRSRSRTILRPYLLWNSLYYGAYAAATRIPAICQIIGKPPVPLTAGEFLKLCCTMVIILCSGICFS